MISFWNFRKISPSEMNYDPIQGEFFTGSDIVDRLVRETLQNSLDVKKGKEPVRIRFAIHSAEPDFLKRRSDFYFSGLLPHLHSAGSEFDPSEQELIYIVIEDFGTTGLTGNPEQTTDDKDNHFYYFFRNVGRSGKGQDKGGSWGLGKWVLPDASQLNAFFALTRRDDGNTLLMGQAVIKQHTINDVKYDPYGFFSRTKDDESGLQIPFNDEEDGAIIDDFRSDFNLRRNDESGLSIVIPFLSETESTIRAEDIVRAVIKHYFYPIISDNLTVEISDATGTKHLRNDNIKDVIPQVDWPEDRELNSEDLIQLIDMLRGGLQKPEDAWLRLNHSPRRNIEEMLGVQKEALMDRFDSGETLYFRIPVSVREKRESTENISYFEAIVQKDESIDQGKDYYVRGNLAIQDIDTIKSYQARAFVHIKEDESLAHLLRDTEEPSHSNWRTGAARAKAKYVNVDPTVRFVKNAVRDILATLTKDKKEKVRENAFIDVFFVKKPKTSPGENGHKPTPPTPSPVIPPRPEPYLFQIGKISSGFTVSAQDGLGLPECINIQLAYECKGNPLSKYSSFDFQLDRSPILIEHGNCSCEAENNCLEIKNICRGFKVVVTGFDVNRDLYIKAESIEQQGKGND